jgi:hypothetical protein
MPVDNGSESFNVSINQGLFPNALGDILASPYGAKIADGETKEPRDTGVQVLAEEVARVLASSKLVFTQPITIHTRVNGEPAIRVIYESGMPGVDGQPGREGDPGAPGAPGEVGPTGPTAAMQVVNAATGETASFGIGLQNIGIVANEFVPLPFFFLNPETTNQQLTNTGGNTGPTGTTGYNPPSEGNTGVIGRDTGSNYGGLVGQGTGWEPLSQNTPGVPPSASGGGVGFPFATGPLGFSFWASYFGGGGGGGSTQPPPGGTDGFTGDLVVVTDVEWDEDTCEMTKTTETWTFEDGLLKSVS